MTNSGNIALHIKVKGRVQGVGFRPFIYRTAHNLKLLGYVYNQPDGVIVYIEGSEENCSLFSEILRKQAPMGAVIKSIEIAKTDIQKPESFRILPSKSSSAAITEICPDIAVCPDCLSELYSNDRRNGYPFINCTNCGPRFTANITDNTDNAGKTYDTFRLIKEIKRTPAFKKSHCLIRLNQATEGIKNRKVGVNRAYVAKAMEYGLDAAFVDTTHHYGQNPADPGLIKVIDAFTQIDGSVQKANEVRELIGPLVKDKKKVPAKT